LQRPDWKEPPEGMEDFEPGIMQRPDGVEPPEKPEGFAPDDMGGMPGEGGEASELFTITAGGNWFVM